MRNLLNAVSSTPVASDIILSATNGKDSGHVYTIIATASVWTGTSVRVEISPDAITWSPTGLVFDATDNVPKNLHVGDGVWFRVNATAVAASALLTVHTSV